MPADAHSPETAEILLQNKVPVQRSQQGLHSIKGEFKCDYSKESRSLKNVLGSEPDDNHLLWIRTDGFLGDNTKPEMKTEFLSAVYPPEINFPSYRISFWIF